MTELAIPAGYWQNANGELIPESRIKDIDKARDSLVKELFGLAREQAGELKHFKEHALGDIAAFVSMSADQYGAKLGGEKGNVTLVTFDGRYKIQRGIQETLAFDERLQAAKVLIDNCIHGWAEGANDNLVVLVNHAFAVDKEGKVSTGRVLALRQAKIDDAQWLTAMDAIADSLKTVSSKAHVRFYERDANGEYQPLSLDFARAG
jgi:hypothetical protein